MGYLCAIIVQAFFMTTIVCFPLQDSVDVTLIKSERDELEARVEWGNDGMELWVQAEPNRLLIRSLADDGELFIYGEKKEGSGIFYTTQGRSFFTTETIHSDGTATKTDYKIPNSAVEQAKEAFEQRKIDRMLTTFDRTNTEQSTSEAIEGLLHRPEVLVLEKTIRILGEEHGIIGRNNRGALLFYTTVLQLVKGREGEIAPSDHANGGDMNSVRGSRNKRRPSNTYTEVEQEKDSGLNISCSCEVVMETVSPTHTVKPTASTLCLDAPTTATPSPTCPPPGPRDFESPYKLAYSPHSQDRCAVPIPSHLHACRNPKQQVLLCEDCFHGHECRRYHCPFDEEDCLGMCGRRCSCWRIVCGDCCVWPGCVQHDLRCGDSFFSFSCLLPFTFNCDGYR